jgi:hypothetical protein
MPSLCWLVCCLQALSSPSYKLILRDWTLYFFSIQSKHADISKDMLYCFTGTDVKDNHFIQILEVVSSGAIQSKLSDAVNPQ